MSIWPVILVLFFVFFVAMVSSFRKEPSLKRTLMRFVAAGMFVGAVALSFVVYDELQEVETCPHDVSKFYTERGALCFGYQNIQEIISEQKQLEISGFRIINGWVAVIETPDNGHFRLTKKGDQDGFYVNVFE